MAAKLKSGPKGFTLDDFLSQLEQVSKMGSISKLLGMLPGMAQMRDQINSIDDRDVARVGAIIKSMTPAERHDPKLINGSRRARIAKGSGVHVSEVSNLVTRFFEARKMMSAMAGGRGIPGMPGMPGMGAGARKPKQQKAAKGKRQSGNPLKRAQEQAAAQQRKTDGNPQPQPGGAFGLGAGQGGPSDFELPKEFKDLL
jgi:signal recognition particle subunit SRP54